jgi:hypothetical protein
MGVLETLIKTIIEAAPRYPGFQPPFLYLLMNLVLPVLLGMVLAWVTKLMEKGLIRLLGEKR